MASEVTLAKLLVRQGRSKALARCARSGRSAANGTMQGLNKTISVRKWA